MSIILFKQNFIPKKRRIKPKTAFYSKKHTKIEYYFKKQNSLVYFEKQKTIGKKIGTLKKHFSLFLPPPSVYRFLFTKKNLQDTKASCRCINV